MNRRRFLQVADGKLSAGDWEAWVWAKTGPWLLAESGDDERPTLVLDSRQDCDDLIALLERVRERLPDGR